ncbi:MAG: hypothetical protein V1728_01820 [Candidatus Micrarchaeota archaeon]
MADGPYAIEFGERFTDYLAKVPIEICRIFAKRLETKYKTYTNFEHKKWGVPLYSDRICVGKYRVCFMQVGQMRRMEFIGDHKAYDKFLAEWENEARSR